VARAILLLGAGLWAVAGLAGLGLAMAGVGALVDLLPPLSIDDAALGRTVAALAILCLGVAACHAVLALGLGRGHRWARSGGVLLAATMAVAFVGLAIAALTSGAAGTMDVVASVPSALGALTVAATYGLVGVTLIGSLRARDGF
jgi:hypothetical protein